jgi:predicted DsbA family dithiol-disulfide isomerase
VSYQIHPETPPEGISLERIFGAGFRERQQGIAERCRELGLRFEPPQLLSNSRRAVEAAEFAREAGVHGAFHRAVLTAYFADSEDIAEVEVLRRAADSVGLDADSLDQALAGGVYAGRRKAAEEEARRLRITGVPTFFIGSRPPVIGAQPFEYFRSLLATGWSVS